MRVKEVMTREVRSCHLSDSMNTAAQIMWEIGCGVVPVLDENEKLVGMITDRDICMAAYASGKPLRDLPVKAATSKEIWSVTQQDSLWAAEALMQTKAVRRLPVVDAGGRLVGILSLHDIAREAVRQRCAIIHQVNDEEVGRTLAMICKPRSSRSVPPAESKKEPAAAPNAAGGNQ